jgi:magnesium transporter
MQHLYKLKGGSWLDLEGPSDQEVTEAADRHGLHPDAVLDFLSQPHLPKCERLPGQIIVIVRGYDELADRGDNIQALTRRLVLLLKDGMLITLHRRDQPYIVQVREKMEATAPSAERLLLLLCGGAVASFADPLKVCEEQLDDIETALMTGQDTTHHLRELFDLKRRCSVIKRTLWRTITVLDQLKNLMEDRLGQVADIREDADRLCAWSDELLENANHIMTLELGVASHRTNDVMRVLTVFSAFFLPLTFIAGVYGMNFKWMPELEKHYGYPLAWLGMGLVTLGIFLWFRRRGWLK